MIRRYAVASAALVVGPMVLLSAGCPKHSDRGSTSPAEATDTARQDTGAAAEPGMHAGHDTHGAGTAGDAGASTQPQTDPINQKTCPVSDEPIDPKVFTEYQGRKVYFCCDNCIKKFQKDPPKYLQKLDAGG